MILFQAEVLSGAPSLSSYFQMADSCENIETSNPAAERQTLCQLLESPPCISNNFQHYRQREAVKLQKNAPLFPFRYTTETFCMGVSTLNHSSNCTVDYQWQDKLFTHQLGSSSSLPGAVWGSPCDHLPLHRSSECVQRGALSSLSKQVALAEAASSRLAQAVGRVTIRYLHVF